MWFFDNSNLNESYSGVITPATQSFARRVYKAVYTQFCQIVGVSQTALNKNREIFEDMVVSIGGRMYYDLSSWHSLIKMLPGYKQNSVFLEEMMGIEKEMRGKVTAKPPRPSTPEVLALAWVGVRITCLFLFMPWLARRFNQKFDHKYEFIKNQLSRALKSDMSIPKLMELYVVWESELTKDFRVPIVNDFAVMIGTGVLRKVLGEDGAKKYIRGFPGIKSAQAGTALGNLIRKVKEGKIRPGSKMFDRMLDKYIAEFGNRVPGELKLESLSFKANRDVLESFVRSNLGNFETNEFKLVSRKTDEKPLVSLLIWWVKSSISIREETRYKRALAFSIVRDFLLGVGKKLEGEKKIDTRRDIFWLRMEELINLKDIKSIKKIIKSRKEDHLKYEKLKLPRRIVSESRNINLNLYLSKSKTPSKGPVAGMVACKGGSDRIKGEALVLTKFEPNAKYLNKILVVTQTDPGWTIVFPLLKGIVVERGGVLSHASIVSREYGKPCIVGASRATEMFKTGDKISMDLVSGEVKNV